MIYRHLTESGGSVLYDKDVHLMADEVIAWGAALKTLRAR